jgi:hypothetical protein
LLKPGKPAFGGVSPESGRLVRDHLRPLVSPSRASPLFAKAWRITDFQGHHHRQPRRQRRGQRTHHSDVFVGEWHGIHRIHAHRISRPGSARTTSSSSTSPASPTASAANSNTIPPHPGGNRDLKIYIPDAVDATRTVEIAYRVRNGTRFFDAVRRVLLERDRQRLARAHRSRRRHRDLPRHAARIAARAGLHRRLRLDRARRHGQSGRLHRGPSKPTIRLPMRGGMTIDVYIPKGILHPAQRLTKLFLVHRQQPDRLFAAGHFGCDVHRCGGSRAAIPIPACRSRPCMSRRKGVSPAECRNPARRPHPSPRHYIDHRRSSRPRLPQD